MTTPTAYTKTVIEDGRIVVQLWWTGVEVDRPNTYGVVVKNMAIAKRLDAATRAGKAFPFVAVIQDVNGKSYVKHGLNVLGRYMNADLKALGF